MLDHRPGPYLLPCILQPPVRLVCWPLLWSAPTVARSSPWVDVCRPQGLATAQDPSIWALPCTPSPPPAPGWIWRDVGTGLHALAFPRPLWRHCPGTSAISDPVGRMFCGLLPTGGTFREHSVCSRPLLGKPEALSAWGVLARPSPAWCFSSASSPQALIPRSSNVSLLPSPVCWDALDPPSLASGCVLSLPEEENSLGRFRKCPCYITMMGVCPVS